MADARFYRRAGPFALGELAGKIGASLADPAAYGLLIQDIASLDEAGSTDLTVFSEARYRGAYVASGAGAIVTKRELVAAFPVSGARLVYVAEPRLAFAQACNLFYPAAFQPALHPHAVIAPDAAIGADCRIDGGAVIEACAQIGARCQIGANAVIGPGVVLGDDCTIGQNASISHALIGRHVRILSGARIGTQGFGFVAGPRGPVRIPQLGRVIIGDDVEVGANSTVDRGATGDTVIGAGSVIDNLVQIAHNVRIGRCCILAAGIGIAGSTRIGDGVVIGGQVAIADHLTIGAGARIAARSGVMRDIEPGITVGGAPALPIREWHRQTAGLARLFNSRPRER